MRRLSQLVSRLSVRRKRRSVQPEEQRPAEAAVTEQDPPSSPETPLTPATTEDSVIPNLDDLEFSASRDLALFLGNSNWSTVKNQTELTAFPAFEYLLPPKTADNNNSTADNNQEQKLSLSAAPQQPGGKSRFKTLPKKAGHRLSMYRPKSTLSLLKKSRSTPNFAEA